MILAIAGQKGGTGKSTVTVGLAGEMHARGLNVLLVDADPQGTARTWGDVAAEAGISAPTIVAMGSNMAEPGQLPKLAENYDITVVDCPGRDGRTQRAALLVADLAILPCGPSAPEAWALAGSVEVVQEAQMLNQTLQGFVCVNRNNPRTVIGQHARKSLKSLGLPLLKKQLSSRVSFEEFLASGLPLSKYAPGTAASKELKALTDEVLTLLNRLAKPTLKEAANG